MKKSIQKQKSRNQEKSDDSPIQIRGKKTYGFCQRLFCCKCFGCCQEEDRSLLTSNNRKDISKRLISQFKSEKENAYILTYISMKLEIFTNNKFFGYSVSKKIEDPLQILIRLYIDDNEETIFQLLNKTRINPDLSENHIWRDDLEFYLPQICNFFVFHEELKNIKLKEFLKKAGMIDFYFAHLVCFYLKSVAQYVTKYQIQDFPQVWNVLEELYECYMQFYYGKQLVSAEIVEQLAMGKQYVVPHKLNRNGNQNEDDALLKKDIIQTYGTTYYEKNNQIQINPEDITLTNYINIQDFIQSNQKVESVPEIEHDNALISENQQLYKNGEVNGNNIGGDLKDGFFSTVLFFNDIMEISENLKFSDPKIVSLRHELQKINSQLPAAVYVPFFSNSFRNHVILNIVTQECKVFSTKERSPFYICLELFRSEEVSKTELNSPMPYIEEKQKTGEIIYKWNYDERLSQPLTLNNQEQKSMSHDIESGLKSSISTKKNISNEQLNTNIALLDKKTEHSEDQIVQISSAQSQTDQQEQISNVSKTLEINTQNIAVPKKNIHNRSIDLSMNASQGQKRSLNENQMTESVSGISCVYQKGMKVPSHYNIKDLDWQTNKASQKAQIKSQQEIIQLDNQKGEQNGNSESNFNYTSKNMLTENQIPSTTDSIKPVKKYSKDELQSINLNDEKFSGLKNLFGEDTRDQESRIRKNSPFGHFKSWKLVHMIIKTGDNIKQEQFAVQLIYQFDQIFKMEGLDLKLTPYEIVSLGPQCGIMEMVKNSITLDGLLKQIHSYKEINNLNHFFQLYYGSQFKKAQQNFCSSLVAYSLVCYFLQIKDRHNGNILLHKNGHIIHIDFGFFLSNAPGKGLAFEQNVPFKLLSDYISILGGVESEEFKNFRRLFFKGFQAACKHQDKILILVKMLYSGHGLTLPCFEKGEQSILDLEARFNPPDISNDGELSLHCNMLINQALDNWRARWYDKWQYFCQGIFY